MINRKDGENPQQYLWRLGNLKDAGVIDYSWKDLLPIYNEQTGRDYTEATVLRKEYATAKRYKANVFDLTDDSSTTKMVESEARKIQARDKNTETNRWLREYARDEEITNRVREAVAALTPVEIPTKMTFQNNERIGVLCFGDEHFGTEFTVYGLDGEVINKYNDAVFYKRMSLLLERTLKIVEDNNLTDLRVYSFGDFADGILRVSQLLKLQYGIVESTVKYSEYICQWLTELTKHVRVQFQMTPGNHTELRMIGQPKSTFKNENMDLIVRAFIKERMKDNPNFTFKENKTGWIYDDIFGYKILGVHGEVNGTGNVLKDFSTVYKEHINYFMAAHKHHSRSEEVGIDCEFIGVPSIIGVDTYSMDIRKTANPAATLLIFERGYGKTVQYYIKLSN